MLQRVQPALIGLIDGTVSTLAPIFATAFIAGSRAALLVGLAAALGAAISMGLSEALSDDGALTGRGSSLARGLITGVATFVGGSAHALPFLISDVGTAPCMSSVTASWAMLRRYSRSAGVARSYRDPKKPTPNSLSASGAATRTSSAVIGERCA